MSMLINPYLFAVPGGGGCDPADFSGATGFFDATAASLPGLADLGAVGSTTNWIDQITGTRNYSQGTSGLRPTLHTTGGPNGQSYISFDSGDIVEFSNTISTILSASQYTMFFVCRPQRDGTNDDPQWCAKLFGPSNGFVGVSLRNVGAGNKFVLYQFSGSYASVSSTTTYSQNVWYIVECWYDGTDINIKVNNDAVVSAASGNIGSLANNTNVGQEGLTSDVAGIYFWNEDIGSTNRDSFRSCLGTRFGITLP